MDDYFFGTPKSGHLELRHDANWPPFLGLAQQRARRRLSRASRQIVECPTTEVNLLGGLGSRAAVTFSSRFKTPGY
jgi:hypothetical protein